MWIRSQDGAKLYEVNNLTIDRLSMCTTEWAVFTSNDRQSTEKVLGVYRNKKRALEVLDEIQQAIIAVTGIPFVVANMNEGAMLAGIANKVPSILEKYNNLIERTLKTISDIGEQIVYQMPKE